MDDTVGLWLIVLSFLAVMFGPLILNGMTRTENTEGHMNMILMIVMIMFFLIGIFTFE